LTDLCDSRCLKGRSQALKKQRVIAYAGAIVFAALLPPTDLLSLLLLTLPLVILFELTVLLNKTVPKV